MFQAEPQAVKQSLTEAGLIALFVAIFALLVWGTGLDAWLAQKVYNPQAGWAWKLRSYGALPGGILATLGLLVCFIPGAPKRWPLMYRSALVLMLTTIVGAGLVNQVIIQEIANRHRPRETVLATTPLPIHDENEGNSMPSGHAAMGFILAAPYFVLRRRGHNAASHPTGTRNMVAYAFLIGGLLAGGLIGYARMVVGAHFLSDVLVAGGISLAASRLFKEVHRISVPLLAIASVVAVSAFILGNHFTVNLTYNVTEPFRRVTLPCTVQTTVNPSLQNPVLQARVEGYGAPVSQLKLGIQHGALTLITNRGLYHSLQCTAYLSLPPSSVD